MLTRNNKSLAIALLLMIVCAVIGWYFLSFRPRQSREHLIGLHQDLSLGLSKAEVLNVWKAANTTGLKLVADTETVQRDRWIVLSGQNFDSGAWVLHVDFSAENEVTALQIRIRDSEKVKPASSPPDRE